MTDISPGRRYRRTNNVGRQFEFEPRQEPYTARYPTLSSSANRPSSDEERCKYAQSPDRAVADHRGCNGLFAQATYPLLVRIASSSFGAAGHSAERKPEWAVAVAYGHAVNRGIKACHQDLCFFGFYARDLSRRAMQFRQNWVPIRLSLLRGSGPAINLLDGAWPLVGLRMAAPAAAASVRSAE